MADALEKRAGKHSKSVSTEAVEYLQQRFDTLAKEKADLAEVLGALLEIIRRGGVSSAKDVETCKRAEKLLSEVVG